MGDNECLHTKDLAKVVTLTNGESFTLCLGCGRGLVRDKPNMKLVTTDELLHELASQDIPFAIVAERADNLPKGNFFVAWKQGQWGKRILLRAIRRLRDEIEDALDDDYRERGRDGQ